MPDWELFVIKSGLEPELVSETASEINDSVPSGLPVAIAYAPATEAESTARLLASSMTELKRPYHNLKEDAYLSGDILLGVDPREWFMWYQSIINNLVIRAFNETRVEPGGLSLVVPARVKGVLDSSKVKSMRRMR